MRKIFALLFTLVPLSLWSLPLGNPLEPSLLTKGVFSDFFYPYKHPCFFDIWGLKLGYYGDFVWDRHMRARDRGERRRSNRKIEMETDALCIALNFWNRIDLFCTLGGTEIFLIRPGGDFDIITDLDRDRVAITTNTNFAWSAGLRAVLWECGCFGIGAEMQYAQSRPELVSIRLREEFLSADIRSLGAHINYHEWQIGLGAAYRIPVRGRCVSFVPYAGIKWAHAVMKATRHVIPLTPTLNYLLSDFESARDIGVAFGVAMIGCKRANLSLEGRVGDERAIHIDFHFRF